MKHFRTLALLAALVAFAAPAAHAQGGQGSGRGGARMMEMLMQGIALSDAQKTQVDSINTAFRAQMPTMTPGTPPDSATREKMRETREKQYAAIRAVLTTEQQTTFDKNLQEMRNRMPQRPRR